MDVHHFFIKGKVLFSSDVNNLFKHSYRLHEPFHKFKK